jgi:hypothetical protein
MRWMWRVPVALVIVFLPGASVAQPASTGDLDLDAYWSIMRHDVAPWFYDGLRGDVIDKGRDSVGARVMNALSELLAGRHEGSDDETRPGDAVCVSLAGAGQNPRWDGGGGLVSTASAPGDDPRLAFTDAVIRDQDWGTYGLHAGLPQARIVIVDAFAMDGLVDAFDAEGTAGAWSALVDAFDTDPVAPGVPHGHLVLYHLLRALVPDGSEPEIRVDRVGPDVVVDVRGLHTEVTIHLVGVDYGEESSIRDGFTSAVSIAHAGPPEGTVVNLSWALVDCAISAEYRVASEATEAGDAHLDYVRYLASLAAELDDGALQGLVEGICDVDVDLFAALTSVQGCDAIEDPRELVALVAMAALAETDVRARAEIRFDELDLPELAPIFVAAAGNQGLAFPMPPASWAGVLGVASCQPPPNSFSSDLAPSFFSNAPGFDGGAEPVGAIAVGAFFAAPMAHQERHGVDVGYYGTSFAAPAVTAAIAAEGLGTIASQLAGTHGFALSPCAPYAFPD